jgi:hypothetical protein
VGDIDKTIGKAWRYCVSKKDGKRHDLIVFDVWIALNLKDVYYEDWLRGVVQRNVTLAALKEDEAFIELQSLCQEALNLFSNTIFICFDKHIHDAALLYSASSTIQMSQTFDKDIESSHDFALSTNGACVKFSNAGSVLIGSSSKENVDHFTVLDEADGEIVSVNNYGSDKVVHLPDRVSRIIDLQSGVVYPMDDTRRRELVQKIKEALGVQTVSIVPCVKYMYP